MDQQQYNFNQAANQMDRLKRRPTNQDQVRLYALYKQATIGDLTMPRPGMMDIEGTEKWDAWNKLRGKSKEQAKDDYIELAEEMKEKYGI